MTKPAQPSVEQLNQFAEQFRTAMVPAFQRMAEQLQMMRTALQPLIELHQQRPELFIQLGQQVDHCHCLCGGHPEQPGVCTGEAEAGVGMTFDSPAAGRTFVRMCRNCHSARSGEEIEYRVGEPELGELEAVTDTCTCHCWVNHPRQQGVCEAASDPGVTVDGRPACLGCAGATR